MAGAHEAPRQSAGVLALLENCGSRDKRGLVAVDPLHETTPAGRKIVHEFRLVEPQAIEVDQVHVGAQAGRQSAAVT